MNLVRKSIIFAIFLFPSIFALADVDIALVNTDKPIIEKLDIRLPYDWSVLSKIERYYFDRRLKQGHPFDAVYRHFLKLFDTLSLRDKFAKHQCDQWKTQIRQDSDAKNVLRTVICDGKYVVDKFNGAAPYLASIKLINIKASILIDAREFDGSLEKLTKEIQVRLPENDDLIDGKLFNSTLEGHPLLQAFSSWQQKCNDELKDLKKQLADDGFNRKVVYFDCGQPNLQKTKKDGPEFNPSYTELSSKLVVYLFSENF